MRCKQVLAILLSRLETVELIREEVHAQIGDFADGSFEMAVVRWNGLEAKSGKLKRKPPLFRPRPR